MSLKIKSIIVYRCRSIYNPMPNILNLCMHQESFELSRPQDWESFVDDRLSEEWEDYGRIKRERRSKCVYNHHVSRKGYANLVDELMFPIVQLFGKKHEKKEIMIILMMLLEIVPLGFDSRCKSDKKRSNHSRSSIGSINIDLDVDEDLVNTSSNKRVEGTPCQLSTGSVNNVVVVATVVEDNIGCSNVKVLVDVIIGENLTIPNPEHSTRKDDVYSSNYTDVNGTIKLLNRHVVNNMKDVDMIRIPMNKQIFGSDKFFYLAREDLLHYCGMVEIGYMRILAYIKYLWDECDCARKFFVIEISSHVKDCDLRSRNLANQLEAANLKQKVLIPYSLYSKVNEDIHGVINVVEDMARETPSTTLSVNSKMETCKGCGYYVQKYIHEIVHNSSTSITSLFNTKSAYRQ
ncbi:uncharacterized protein E5676_scaffold874G00550 [Cucumis melo var. makuwa]|uniref:Uncharacterized protein n=1 Tax=Cucumis melo var. makuwa TaxID=1194695 RepID=A0A5A7UZS3_CUCMM|nr:uncharacterized protein E6C27_scaffold98G001720 [Cucumis melo var. makuwa]TYK11013.1 uncharacterized protein E5676_scaffold874G00550 [Cucumis melo var. makuwa]